MMEEEATTEQNNWVVDIKGKLEKMGSLEEEQLWKKHSIYRVPTGLKEINKNAYKPQVVSFGPYHHGEPDLMHMEGHKRRSLIHFLKRTGKPIEDCVNAIDEVVQKLMDSYEQLDEAWKDPKRFVQLMILDGCFMLEVLRVSALGSFNSQHSIGYAYNDPIFSSHGKLHNMPHIRRDILLIENQIPLLVLEKLVAIETGKPKNEDYINKLIMKFCNPCAPGQNVGTCLHVLDMVRNSALQGPQHRSRSSANESTGEIIRSAMELHEAGIRFKKSKTLSLTDITFHRGVLSLPSIIIDDTTESSFLNLMAFERLHVGAGNEVTSYVFFMDNIIDSAKDVSLLQSKGIIHNAIGSDKAVAKLFNGLSKDATLDPDSNLDEVHNKVNDYCKKRWNKWRANLVHTYFRSPWALISLLAAVFLMGLTVAQTLYSILPYYESPSTTPTQVPSHP